MVQYVFDGASLAASTSSPNYLAGDKVAQASYPRTVQAIAVVIQLNTPALGDMSWELSAGPLLLATGQGQLGQTTGAEIRIPDDLQQVGQTIAPNTVLSLVMRNLDAGAAHSARVYFLMDRL